MDRDAAVTEGCFGPIRISDDMKERIRLNEQRARARYARACAIVCGLSLLFGVGAFAAMLVWPWMLLAWPLFVWALYRFYLRKRRRFFPMERFRFPRVRNVGSTPLSDEIVAAQPMVLPSSPPPTWDVVYTDIVGNDSRGR